MRPDDLNQVLTTLVDRQRSILQDNLVGSYLQGSFALGDWDEHSDVDFLTVITEELSESQLHALQKLHSQIYDVPIPWAKHLEGAYFPAADIKQNLITGRRQWWLNNTAREMILSDHDDALVVRWVLREHGVALLGPQPNTLLDPIPTEALKAEIRNTMKTWGGDLIANPEIMNNQWYQPFAVVIFCRMLHTLESGRVTSKPAAASWAKNALDPRWTGLIDRSCEMRPDPGEKIQLAADPADLSATVDFIGCSIARAGSQTER